MLNTRQTADNSQHDFTVIQTSLADIGSCVETSLSSDLLPMFVNCIYSAVGAPKQLILPYRLLLLSTNFLNQTDVFRDTNSIK
jgi:hypothetical protein